MREVLLSLSNIALTFGGAALFDNADLSVAAGSRIALVGRNGAGKSTLLKIAAGLVEPDTGERFAHPRTHIRYLAQEPDTRNFPTTLSFIAAGLLDQSEEFRVEALAAELSLNLESPPSDLSGGELRKAAIAQALVSEPEVILLDEPTNHLDLPAIAWLEERLNTQKSALVAISHDRRFLENLTTETVWVDRGSTKQFSLGFSKFEAARDKLLEEEEAGLHKLGRKIAAEEDWMRYGVTARRKRNMRRVGELNAMRKKLREHRRAPGAVNFSLGDAERSGKRLIRTESISKTYDDRTIVKDFSIEIARGDRVGIVGPNGAGKTTLINMLTGEMAPDTGRVDISDTAKVITLDQRRAALEPNARLIDAITDGRGDWVSIGDTKRHASSYLKDFLFSGEQWRAPVSSLSGGERARLALAIALTKPSNLLVLDEPTNDLDLETLDLLEDLLANYDGALLLVSHDRSFLDRIVTSVITTEPDKPGYWLRYAGGYQDMVAQRGAAPGLEQAKPPSEERPKASKERIKTARGEKLSFKEKFALENLPGQIAELEEKASALKAKMEDPEFYSKDPAGFERSASALADVEATLAAAEEEWLALELKRESLE